MEERTNVNLLDDVFFFFSSRRRHTRWTGDWSSDVCSSDLSMGRQMLRGLWRTRFQYGRNQAVGQDGTGQPRRFQKRLRLPRGLSQTVFAGAENFGADRRNETGLSFPSIELIRALQFISLCAHLLSLAAGSLSKNRPATFPPARPARGSPRSTTA